MNLGLLGFSLWKLPDTRRTFLKDRELIDDEESNTPCLDYRTCAFLEDTGSKEDHGSENRQDIKAHRGCNAAKGVSLGLSLDTRA